MSLTTISPQMQQRLAIFVPLVALAVSLFIVYPTWGRYNDLKSKIEQHQRELDTLKNTPLPKISDVKPTKEDEPSERPEFFGRMKALAANAGCDLVSYDATAAEDSKKSEGDVRAVRAKVDVEGQYRQVREFLWLLSHNADRLLTVTEVDIHPAQQRLARAPGAVRASMTIERYVMKKVTEKS